MELTLWRHLFVLVCLGAFDAIFAEPLGVAICGEKGFKNETTGSCECINGYYGFNCKYRYCPFGTSWHSKPVTANERNTELVSCSNMGDCDTDSGTCSCREGFEGRACERMACPTRPLMRMTDAAVSYPSSVSVDIGASGSLNDHMPGSGNPTLGTLTGVTMRTFPHLDPVCSGHGICRSMAEAARNYNGHSLTHPPVFYTNWEADKIQGCLCDAGWDGYDCSQRQCPWGRDPQDANIRYQKNEVFAIECQATAGYFAIQILDGFTAPIPFDADPTYVKNALEQVPRVGTVDVVIQEDIDGMPRVCGHLFPLLTEFTLLDHPGQMAPARIITSLAASRAVPDSDTSLTQGPNPAPINFMSKYELTCGACVNCHGNIHFTYGDSITSAIDITTAGAAAAIETAVMALSDLVGANWPQLKMNVTMTDAGDKVCVAGGNTVTLKLYSPMGNIPGLGILDGSYLEAEAYVQKGFGGESMNIAASFVSNSGNGTLYECSNQGLCDRSTGTCQCLKEARADGLGNTRVNSYKASSSDGFGGKGHLGDCGHIEQNLGCQYDTGNTRLNRWGDASDIGYSSEHNNLGLENNVCGGHGTCRNNRCECHEGFMGLDCAVKTCPLGPAWFDEPTGPLVAHKDAECSNFGICDRFTGICRCRDGYTGTSCQIKDCPRDISTGESCSGHGYCKSKFEIGALYGVPYGARDVKSHANPSVWDANNWYECLCYSKYSAGEFGNPLRTSTAPKDWVGRYSAGALPTPGFTGYMCHQHLCPRGDSKMGDNSNRVATIKEEQRIVCTLAQNANHFFKLSLHGRESGPIHTNYVASEIKSAIELNPMIGNVTITFDTGVTAVYANPLACESTGVHAAGSGFVVEFDTEGGDLPLMGVVNTFGSVAIAAKQDGSSENLECGGPAVGMCDRSNGVCACRDDLMSSDGNNGLGTNGDCGFSPGQEHYLGRENTVGSI